MRPLAVQSVLWRVVASTIARSEPVIQWLLQVAPPEAHGAIPGGGVDTALAALEDDFHRKKGVWATFDYTKAYDMVSPEFAIQCLAAAGWPSAWAEILGHVCFSQQRWPQWGSRTLPACVHVSQSMLACGWQLWSLCAGVGWRLLLHALARPQFCAPRVLTFLALRGLLRVPELQELLLFPCLCQRARIYLKSFQIPQSN